MSNDEARARRKAALERFLERTEVEPIEKLADKRFIAVEETPEAETRWFARGYDNIRDACAGLSERLRVYGDLPQYVIDLDSGERIDVDAHVTVVPRRVDAAVAVLPRRDLESLVTHIGAVAENAGARRALERLRAVVS